MAAEILNNSDRLRQSSDQLINKAWQLKEETKKHMTKAKQLIAKRRTISSAIRD
jgi:seryl-tRNA synthetase